MNIETLKKLYVVELQEAHSIGLQLSDALPEMIETATAEDLKEALQSHLRETRSQAERMEAILRRHGAETREHRDQSMQAIIAESRKWAEMVDDRACRDVGLIGSAQRIEHYEMAVYGSLSSWANQLGLEEDAGTLHSILEEQKAADETLSQLAMSTINPGATA